ncbi:MAG: archease [Desulfosalsimonas sp.]
MPYEVIDHTADTGIRVWAGSQQQLFTEAARAMFELITDTGIISFTETRDLHIEGLDLTDLLINWLRELLFLWSADQLIVLSTRIVDMTENTVSAKAFAEPFDPEKHVVYTDIKAVTYHGADAGPAGDGWEASVIFDV